jgi:hypothetical protein
MMFALAAIVGLAAPAHAAKFDIEYDASILNVVTLGKVTLKGAVEASSFTADAGVKTSGLAALFDQTDIAATSGGAVGAGGLEWSRFSLLHRYSKIGKPQKSRQVSLTRAGAKVTESVTPKYGSMGDPVATAAQKASAKDPVSAFVSMGLDVGKSKACGGRYQYFDGKQVAALVLSPRSTGAYKGGGYDGKAIVCNMKYEPIAGFKAMTAAERAKIPSGEIWFAEPNASGFAAPVRIEIPTPVGPARLDIKRFTVS